MNMCKSLYSNRCDGRSMFVTFHSYNNTTCAEASIYVTLDILAPCSIIGAAFQKSIRIGRKEKATYKREHLQDHY